MQPLASFSMKMERKLAIAKLAEIIHSIHLNHPVRVGIDGVDASGKTILADELVKPFEVLGRDVIRVSIDRFHNPREVRYRQGRTSPQGYYEDSFNFEAIISQVLEPLGPHGDLEYRPESFDFVSDSEIICSTQQANIESILIFEGVFLHHPKIVEYWDFTVFVQASFETTIKRAYDRDLHLFETPGQIEKLYSTKYIPGQQIYLETESPDNKANVVFHNDNIENPELLIR